MPRSDEREISVSVYMPRSFTLEEMKSLFKNFENILFAHKEEFAIEHLTTEFGVRGMRQGRFRGSIELNLEDASGVGPGPARLPEPKNP